MAAGWAFSLWPGAFPLSDESGAPSKLGIACLADAHLRDGNDMRPEARALARAVAEIQALEPAPDLVLFAGDLAHDNDPGALGLGREILDDLPAPLQSSHRVIPTSIPDLRVDHRILDVLMP